MIACALKLVYFYWQKLIYIFTRNYKYKTSINRYSALIAINEFNDAYNI